MGHPEDWDYQARLHLDLQQPPPEIIEGQERQCWALRACWWAKKIDCTWEVERGLHMSSVGQSQLAKEFDRLRSDQNEEYPLPSRILKKRRLEQHKGMRSLHTRRTSINDVETEAPPHHERTGSTGSIFSFDETQVAKERERSIHSNLNALETGSASPSKNTHDDDSYELPSFGFPPPPQSTSVPLETDDPLLTRRPKNYFAANLCRSDTSRQCTKKESKKPFARPKKAGRPPKALQRPVEDTSSCDTLKIERHEELPPTPFCDSSPPWPQSAETLERQGESAVNSEDAPASGTEDFLRHFEPNLSTDTLKRSNSFKMLPQNTCEAASSSESSSSESDQEPCQASQEASLSEQESTAHLLNEFLFSSDPYGLAEDALKPQAPPPKTWEKVAAFAVKVMELPLGLTSIFRRH